MARPSRRAKKKRAPRKPAAKPIKVSNQANQKSKEYQRCKNWLIAQNQFKPKYPRIVDVDDEGNSNSELDIHRQEVEIQSSSSNNANSTKPISPIQYKVNLSCEWEKCCVEIENFDKFQAHVVTHMNAEKIYDLYECQWDLCNYKTDNPKLLRIHIHFHTYHTNLKTIGETMLIRKVLPPCVLDSRRRNFIPDINSEYYCQWDGCKMKFEKVYEFFDHIKKHCVFESSLRIKYCRKIENAAFKCSWLSCDKEFKVYQRYTDHQRTHTHEKLFGCPNCGSTFNSYTKFYDHFKRQSENNPYQCVECLKYFPTEELLCTHMYVHVNCYKCTLCDMTCPSPSALAKHVRYRHIKDRPFKCSVCPFRAVFKTDMDKHIMLKHEKQVYECEEFGCNFSAESMYLMKKHDKNIHGLGPSIYCCHCCDRRFKEGCRLSRHLIKSHNFQLPSGHVRFTYRQEIDGYNRLQTMRMESLEVTQQIMSPTYTDVSNQNDATYEYAVAEMKNTDYGVSMVIESHLIDPNEEEKHTDCDSIDITECKPSLEPYTSDNERSVSRNSNNEHKFVMPDVSESQEGYSPTKSIDNFSVMKRYLNEKKNNIIIEMNQVDEAGNVVITEVVQADEFCVSENSH